MSKKNVTVSVGPGFVPLLLIVLIALKLTGMIELSWLLVIFLPFIIAIGVFMGVFVIMFLFALIVTMLG